MSQKGSILLATGSKTVWKFAKDSSAADDLQAATDLLEKHSGDVDGVELSKACQTAAEKLASYEASASLLLKSSNAEKVVKVKTDIATAFGKFRNDMFKNHLAGKTAEAAHAAKLAEECCCEASHRVQPLN